MSRALVLAERGRPWAHPNPLVGCVVARGNSIVGEGWHERFGGPHAEAMALKRAGARARGATLYVTLEPCPHWGKTPPCAEAVARAGVRRVIAAGRDPNPRFNGRGLAFLKRAGVRVETGLLVGPAEELNRPFFMRHKRGRPEVVLKLAQTLDGRIASRAGVSRWITGAPARAAGHRLRAEADAVLVGGETVRRDDPGLTAHGAGPDPVRVVLSGSLRLPARAKVWREGAPAFLLTTKDVSRARGRAWEKAGVEVIAARGRGGRVELTAALAALGKRGINRLLVEGGGRTAHAFLSAGLVDEVCLFVAPSFLGGGGRSSVEGPGWARPGDGPRLTGVTVTPVGEDWLVRGRVK